jgi:hypothetical protein
MQRFRRYLWVLLFAWLAGALRKRILVGTPVATESPPPSLAGLQKMQMDSQGQMDSSTAKSSGRRRGTMRVWLVWLLPISIASFVAAGIIWPESVYSGKSQPATGGALLLVEDAPSPGRAVGASTPSAEIDSTLWETGFPGVSILRLDIHFGDYPAGTRWRIAVSGQYAIVKDADPGLFCGGVEGSAEAMPNGFRCRDNEASSSRNVQYLFGDHIGLHSGRAGEIFRLFTADNYEPKTATLVAGEVSSSDRWQTSVWLPIRTPKVDEFGASQYGQFAAIDNDISSGSYDDVVAAKLRENLASRAQYADLEAGIPLEPMKVARSEFRYSESIGRKRIDWSYPATATPVSLVWRNEKGLVGPISFSIFDPFAQDSAARHSFFAGIFVSVGISALLLLLERWLSRRDPA